MNNIHLLNIVNYLDPILKRISQNIFLRKSFLIQSKYPENSNLFINLIFNDYDTRNQYLKRQKDDYILLDLSLITTDLNGNLDDLILSSINLKLQKDFYSLSELKIFLKEHGYIMVLYFSKNSFDRNIFSYKYIFGENVLFIHSSDVQDYIFEDIINVEFEKAFLKVIIKKRLHELNVDSDIDLILNKLDGNITTLDRVIFESLNLEDSSVKDYNLNDIKTNTLVEEPLAEDMSPISNTDIVSENDSKIELILPTQIPETNIVIPELKNNYTQEETKESNTNSTVNISEKDALDIILTPREQKIYEQLVENKKISRDDIADIVWGADAGTKANADAIDQIISRMRKKFVNAGYDKSYITSIKGEGVVLNM